MLHGDTQQRSVDETVLRSPDIRPVWAWSEAYRSRWDGLLGTERKAIAAFLLARRALSAASLADIRIDRFLALTRSATAKLGFETVEEFIDHHTRATFAPAAGLVSDAVQKFKRQLRHFDG